MKQFHMETYFPIRRRKRERERVSKPLEYEKRVSVLVNFDDDGKLLQESEIKIAEYILLTAILKILLIPFYSRQIKTDPLCVWALWLEKYFSN